MACRGRSLAFVRFLGGVAFSGAGVARGYQDHIVQTLDTAPRSSGRERAAAARQQHDRSTAEISQARNDVARATTRAEVAAAVRCAQAALEAARRAGGDKRRLHALERDLEALRGSARSRESMLDHQQRGMEAAVLDVDRLSPAALGVRMLPAPRRGWQFAHGSARHKTLQQQDTAWANQVGLQAEAERRVITPDGMTGFIDHVIYLDDSRRNVVVTEYKTDRFDLRTRGGLTRRMDEILDQIDGYRFAPDLDAETTQALLHIDERPTTPGYADYIEQRCADAHVNVVFLND